MCQDILLQTHLSHTNKTYIDYSLIAFTISVILHYNDYRNTINNFILKKHTSHLFLMSLCIIMSFCFCNNIDATNRMADIINMDCVFYPIDTVKQFRYILRHIVWGRKYRVCFVKDKTNKM